MYDTIKSTIINTIKANGAGEITGSSLQGVLLAIVDALGAGYMFQGIAHPSTDPGSPDNNVFWFANEPGTYAYFGNSVVSVPSFILFNEGVWTVSPLISGATFNLGYGVCTTGTYIQAKEVTIPNFMLMRNGNINILFTTPINVEGATLNVSQTGAKPLRILGYRLASGIIKAQSYATLVYDGEAWNIINIFRPDTTNNFAETVVDMGLSSGVKWATRDIDLTKPGGFCETPFTHEKSFFSWGNIDGYNPVNGSFENVHDWGSRNSSAPYYDGQVYGSTKGCTLAADIPVGEEFDAARTNIGSPWRMPTAADFTELFNSCNFINESGVVITGSDKRTVVEGVTGFYLESTINGNRLFFACSGQGIRTSLYDRNSHGYYWTATFGSDRKAKGLNIYSTSIIQDYFDRYVGIPIRPVIS